MGQPVVHWEFWSEDPGRIATFYVRVFGWKVREIPELAYHLVDTGGEGGINGGIMTPQEGSWPAKMALYIGVDDLDAYREQVREAGGKILVERAEVAEVGFFCLFEDPDGRVLGIWQQEA